MSMQGRDRSTNRRTSVGEGICSQCGARRPLVVSHGSLRCEPCAEAFDRLPKALQRRRIRSTGVCRRCGREDHDLNLFGDEKLCYHCLLELEEEEGTVVEEMEEMEAKGGGLTHATSTR